MFGCSARARTVIRVEEVVEGVAGTGTLFRNDANDLSRTMAAVRWGGESRVRR
jgi:hypothetical protein